jgi:hypothetical protein
MKEFMLLFRQPSYDYSKASPQEMQALAKNMKTTNYYNTFIEIAEDCPVKVAEIPPQKGESKTAASIQYEMIAGHPYESHAFKAGLND